MKKKYILWLDDMRNPWETPLGCKKSWGEMYSKTIQNNPNDLPYIFWVKDYKEFVEFFEDLKNNNFDALGMPTEVCFDHDLGYDGTGKDAANYLCNFCMDNNLPLPEYESHSSNPKGRENILSYLDNFVRVYGK